MSERVEREAATQAAIDGFVQAVTAGRGLARVRPEPGKVSFEQFVQVVRRRRPSDLLPALAAIAAAAPDGKYNLNSPTEFPPWAVSLIARESILRGNEHRNAGLRPKDLADLYNAHANIYEPAHETGEDILLPILTRFVYQQFPYQESVYEEIARTHALLIEPLADLDLEVLTEDAWKGVFGAPPAPGRGSDLLPPGRSESKRRVGRPCLAHA